MIELVDKLPDVNVPPAEYVRLLGYPRGWELEGRALELAGQARAWYARHGRPWIYARRAKQVEADDDGVTVDGARLASRRLAEIFRQAGADGAVMVAVGAGPEIEAQAQQAWLDDAPDEYFFLETYGSAVVEHLMTAAGAHLCAWAESHGRAVLPHYSPGYPEWDIADQSQLLSLIQRPGGHPLPGPLQLLPSGMLRPKKSLLAVFGVTRRRERVAQGADLVPCANCVYAGCQYRRVPYRGPAPYARGEWPVAGGVAASKATPRAAPLDIDAEYAVSRKALERWAGERLALVDAAGGGIAATFRYDGTTCTNMGRALRFDYAVELGSREAGYPIAAARCMPAPDDDGHRSMCQYLEEGDALLAAIASAPPVVGARLDLAIAWAPASSPAGCYCTAESRHHKWALVLQTIHFALAERERRAERQLTEAVTR
jgi:hypothetical protein